uniref:Dolichyl-diphosphooligosaccharide--protein glycosyltransferase subunit 4 n=1 Tax=Parascaris univalens TaxID=6257 RepID=A0A915C429_PARUN
SRRMASVVTESSAPFSIILERSRHRRREFSFFLTALR